VQVSDIMSTDVVTLRADVPLVEAEEIMGWRRIRHIPVVERDGTMAGLVTHRDLLRAYLSGGTRVEQLVHKAKVNVREIMHKKVRTVRPDTSVVDAIELLKTHKYGCLVVVDDSNRLVGIVTDSDMVKLAGSLLQYLQTHHPGFKDHIDL
jgi:CBS domain-containing protein